jgi:hypothetical protein
LVGAFGLARRLILSMMAPIFLWHLRAVARLHLATFAFLFQENRIMCKLVSPVGQPFQAFTALALHTHTQRAFTGRVQARGYTHARLAGMLYFVLFLVGHGLPRCGCREGARALLLSSFHVPGGRQAPFLHPFLPVPEPAPPYLAHCTMIKIPRAPQRSPLMVFLSAHVHCTRTPRATSAPQRPTNNTTKLCHPGLCNTSLVFCDFFGRLSIRRLYLAWEN